MEPTVGELRWRCTLVSRYQRDNSNTAGLITTYENPQTVYCGFQDVSTFAFLLQQQQQIVGLTTHKITMRWIDLSSVTPFNYIVRPRTRRDGSRYTEIFKVERVKEINGRRRWLEVEVSFVERFDEETLFAGQQ